MATYSQADRPLTIATPLGENALLPTGFRGQEGISRLFEFELDLVADSKFRIRFDRILGECVTVEMRLPDGAKRHWNGLVKRFSQGARDEVFAHFRVMLVPKVWLLTKNVRSRIYQRLSTPDILRQVLAGVDVVFELSATYYPREYCVQYRESDFNFLSRLMEEEGIYYFFTHSESGHRMIVSDGSKNHFLPGQTNVSYDVVSGGVRDDMRITAWEKTQTLQSGEYTLWDHSFELPGSHLEGAVPTIDSVPVGKVMHKLRLGGNERLEIYDYPGRYAQRFDGIDRNGVERPENLKQIFEQRDRTVQVRMEEVEAASLEICGASDCGHFAAGHKFILEQHFDGDGSYLLTTVEHAARAGGYRCGQDLEFHYENRFSCIPVALPYRPPRATPRPSIAGVQTATVVGPPGQDLFCDKYGRVKVQFHWDREGKRDQDSSCWLRVAQPWAGKTWGAFFWPRIGNEVVVAFEEGDPDQPLIVGSVYNAENLPPFPLPANSALTGFKSVSVRGMAHQHFNGVVFDDAKGSEHVAIHSERHLTFNAEFDKVCHGGRHKGERVAGSSVLTVGRLPLGGGSGGGHWKPKPQGVAGLNSIMVYGANLQTAVGTNHQVAIGSNFQICVNPAGLAAGVEGSAAPPAITGFLGGGLGGNMQFTIGTSANFVLGRSFDINMGPPKIEVKDVRHIVSNILCGILGALALVWSLVYAVIEDDHSRAEKAYLFQMVFDLGLALLMMVEAEYKKNSMINNIAVQTAFEDKQKAQTEFDVMFGTGGLSDFCEGIGVASALIGALGLPLVAAAREQQSGFDDK